MMQESRNPIVMSNSSGNVYEKLKNLAEEITEGIFNLSGPEVNKNDLRRDVDSIAEVAAREKSPEVMVNVLLFRKYADIANQAKDSKHDSFSFMAELPSLVTEDNVELVGWSALGAKIFWLRLTTCILAFISFVVMSTVPGIQYAEYSPSKAFMYPGCPYFSMDGHFVFRPFQVVLTLGVMIYFYNALFTVYYVLPTDVNKRKFIPGLASLLSRCMSKDRADNAVLSGALCCKTFSHFAEALLDGLLLCLATVSCVVSSIMLERSAQFSYSYKGDREALYFTLGSFYSTFTQTSPVCVQTSNDPGSKIRASLAMLYLTIFVLALCFIVSATAFKKDFKSGTFRSVIAAAGGGGGAAATEEEVVEFRSLPTHSEHNDTSHLSRGEDRSMSV